MSADARIGKRRATKQTGSLLVYSHYNTFTDVDDILGKLGDEVSEQVASDYSKRSGYELQRVDTVRSTEGDFAIELDLQTPLSGEISLDDIEHIVSDATDSVKKVVRVEHIETTLEAIK